MRKLLILLSFIPFSLRGQIITTFAGTGISTYFGNGIPATAAGINDPVGGIFDNSGNYYYADGLGCHRIRKIDAAGIITTVAGTGAGGFGGDGGAATAAFLSFPQAVKLDNAGNLIIADAQNNRVRKVDISSGIISTIAGTGPGSYTGDGGAATNATLSNPQDICVDNQGNIYVAEIFNHVVRKVTPSGIISTFAGTGVQGYNGDNMPATAAQLGSPVGLTIDNAGNIYIADQVENRVRKIDASGIITTVAGNGTGNYIGDGLPATNAQIAPIKVALDGSGQLFIADRFNKRVYYIDNSGIIHVAAGNGSTGFSGDGGPATAASIDYPGGVAFDLCGNLTITDINNFRIRKIYYNTTGVPAISILPNPSTTVCKNTPVIFYSTVSAGTATGYQWLVNGAAVPGATNSSYTYTPADLDSVRCLLTGVSYCSGNTATVSSNMVTMTVGLPTVPTIAISAISSASVGAQVTVTATLTNAGSGYNIRWFNRGMQFAVTTANTVIYTKDTGIDTITARVVPMPISTPPTCYDSVLSSEQIVTVPVNGISHVVPEGGLIVYPNPAHNVVYIHCAADSSAYRLLNMVGIVMQQGTLKTRSNTISLSSLPTGVYMMEVSDGKGERLVRRIVKQ